MRLTRFPRAAARVLTINVSASLCYDRSFDGSASLGLNHNSVLFFAPTNRTGVRAPSLTLTMMNNVIMSLLYCFNVWLSFDCVCQCQCGVRAVQ